MMSIYHNDAHKLKLICLSGHPLDQPDHRAHDLWHRPRAWWCSAVNGSAANSGGSREYACYCKCECEWCFYIVSTMYVCTIYTDCKTNKNQNKTK